MINIQYKKTIDEEVRPILSISSGGDMLTPGERDFTLTVRYVTEAGIEVDREEFFYQKGDEAESFYADWVDTNFLGEEINLNTNLAIEIPQVEDPVL